MTARQYFLRLTYPLVRFFKSLSSNGPASLFNTDNRRPSVSFYSLHVIMNNGTVLGFDAWRGKKVLLVNTASDCGYTGQYAELETLYRQHADKLVVIAFPSNDFGEQEKGTDSEIAQFCKINYGVTFPVVRKSSVIRGDGQNEVFSWLTDKGKNGWNDLVPGWNFSKYLVSETGVLTACFSPFVSPLSREVQNAITGRAS